MLVKYREIRQSLPSPAAAAIILRVVFPSTASHISCSLPFLLCQRKTNHFLFLIFSPFAGGKPRSAPEGGVGGGSTEVVAFCRCGSNRWRQTEVTMEQEGRDEKNISLNIPIVNVEWVFHIAHPYPEKSWSMLGHQGVGWLLVMGKQNGLLRRNARTFCRHFIQIVETKLELMFCGRLQHNLAKEWGRESLVAKEFPYLWHFSQQQPRYSGGDPCWQEAWPLSLVCNAMSHPEPMVHPHMSASPPMHAPPPPCPDPPVGTMPPHACQTQTSPSQPIIGPSRHEG